MSRLAEDSRFGRRTGPGSNWLTEIAAREVIALTQCTVSQRNAHPGALNRFESLTGCIIRVEAYQYIYVSRAGDQGYRGGSSQGNVGPDVISNLLKA